MKLLEKFNIVPNNEDLYVIAFTHSSYFRIPPEYAS